MAVREGERIGPYVVGARIGAGGMGEVYRATDTRLGREVALKVIRAEYAGDAGRSARFEREARAVAALNHPNVVALFDVGTHDGSPYLVTELLEGQPLRDLVARPVAVEWAVALAGQIAAGLAAAHARGVVHRDLKPDNVFVTTDGRAKLLDFGIARVEQERQSSGTLTDAGAGVTTGGVLGTIGYMAPEQVRGQPADARCDVFAFGCVFYELLAGHRAFKGATSVETGYAILNFEPESLPLGTPPHVAELVHRCLEKDPTRRPASGAELAAALASHALPPFVATPAVSPTGTAAPMRPSSTPRRAAMAVLTVATGLGAWGWTGTLPAKVVARIETTHSFSAEEAWLARATQRLLERRLREDRRFTLTDDPTQANTVLRLHVERAANGEALLETSARRSGWGRPVAGARVTAPSVAQALDQVAPALAGALGRDASPLPWSTEELAQAARWGAATPQSLVLYRRFNDCLTTTADYELEPCMRIAQELTALDPGWPRAWLTMELVAGWGPADYQQALAKCAGSKDAIGLQLLRARSGERVVFDPRLLDGDSLFAALCFASCEMPSSDDFDVFAYRAFSCAPHLQWGSFVLTQRRDPGRRKAVFDEWAARAPEAPQRLIELGDQRSLREALFLYGRTPALVMASARTASRNYDFEAAWVEVSGLQASRDPAMATTAARLAAEIAIYDGRFNDAFSAIERALRGNTLLGNTAKPPVGLYPSNDLEVERELTKAVGDPARILEAQQGYDAQIRREPQTKAAQTLMDYELAPGACPDPASFRASLAGSPDEVEGLAILERAIEARGCGSCAAVLRRGLSENEFFDFSLVQFASCARRAKEYDLALKALDLLTQPGEAAVRFGPSPFHVVLGRFERARVLEAMGDKPKALTAWEESLRFWKHADRPMPQLKEAREAVSRLRGEGH